MAIYHLSVKPISRKAGRSAVAAAAYRSGELIHDLSSDEAFDYTRKRGVEHSEIVLPTAVAVRDINWARDRQVLWNAAEAAENRSNSRVAREYEVALPHELTRAQRVELVQEFALEIANRHGVAVDFSIHAPHRSGDTRNHHAHLMASTRTIEAAGLGEKAEIEWSDGNRRKAGLEPAKAEISAIRERWAALTNEKLLEHGLEARVDHRSLEAQGIERTPTLHLGAAVSGMERRGIETEVGKRIGLEEASRRLEQALELGQLERERGGVSQQILALDGDLKAAKKAQQQEKTLELGAEPPKRDRFAGLNLERSANLKKDLFANLQLERQEPPSKGPLPGLEADPLQHSIERYARAWLEGYQVERRGLSMLAHQRIELKESIRELEQVRPGATRDLMHAVRYERGAERAMKELEGAQRGAKLLAALAYEQRVRHEPKLAAERFVKRWNELEERGDSLHRGGDWRQKREQFKGEVRELVLELKKNPQLEAVMRRNSQEFAIEPKSRLWRMILEPDLERAVRSAERDLVHERGHDLGHER